MIRSASSSFLEAFLHRHLLAHFLSMSCGPHSESTYSADKFGVATPPPKPQTHWVCQGFCPILLGHSHVTATVRRDFSLEEFKDILLAASNVTTQEN